MEGGHHVVKKQTSVRLPFSNNEADLILLPICSSLIAHNSTLGNGFPTWENMMFTCNNNNIRSNTRLIIMYIIRFENLLYVLSCLDSHILHYPDMLQGKLTHMSPYKCMHMMLHIWKYNQMRMYVRILLHMMKCNCHDTFSCK